VRIARDEDLVGALDDLYARMEKDIAFFFNSSGGWFKRKNYDDLLPIAKYLL
jgi:hypothetical protein